MKYQLLILMIILMSVGAMSWLDNDRCEVNTDCEIGDMVVNASDQSQVYAGASCNLTVSNSSNYRLVFAEMINLSNGYHYFNLNNETPGFYSVDMLCCEDVDCGRKTGNIIIGTPLYDNQVTILANQATIVSDIDDLESSMDSNFTYVTNNLTDIELHMDTTLVESIWSYTNRTIHYTGLAGLIDIVECVWGFTDGCDLTREIHGIFG